MTKQHIQASDSTVDLDETAVQTDKVNSQKTTLYKLNERLHRKIKELFRLNKEAEVIDDLNLKLQKAEKIIKVDNEVPRLHAETGKKASEHLDNQASEQAALIDELVDQLLEVDIKLAAAKLQNQHIIAQNTVKTHMLAGMTLGLLPAPLFDIAALTGIQLNLLNSLCKHYEVDFDEKLGRSVLTSLITGSIPVVTVVSLSSFIKLIPGIGTISGGLGMTALSGAVIYASGQVFIKHFELGGTLNDFEAKHWQLYFKEQLKAGRKHARKDF